MRWPKEPNQSYNKLDHIILSEFIKIQISVAELILESLVPVSRRRPVNHDYCWFEIHPSIFNGSFDELTTSNRVYGFRICNMHTNQISRNVGKNVLKNFFRRFNSDSMFFDKFSRIGSHWPFWSVALLRQWPSEYSNETVRVIFSVISIIRWRDVLRPLLCNSKQFMKHSRSLLLFHHREWKEKYDLVDDEESDTLTYNYKNTFIYKKEKNGPGLTGDEIVTMPNPCRLS